MPTAIYRAQFFFKMSKWGFSDSFFQSLDDATTLNVFAAKAATLMWRRVCILNPAWLTVSMRVSREGVFRDSRVFFPGIGNNYAALATTVNDMGIATNQIPFRGRSDSYIPDKPQPVEAPITLLCRGEAGELHRREVEFHGIDETIVSAAGALNPNGAAGWGGAFTKLKNELLNVAPNAGSGPWQVRCIDFGQPLFGVFQVTSPDAQHILVQLNPDGPIMKVVPPAGPVPVTVGNFVQIRGVRKASGVNGIWRIATINAGPPFVYTLVGTPNHLVALPAATNLWKANVRYYQVITFPFDTFAAEDIGERAIGRPSDSARGRNRHG